MSSIVFSDLKSSALPIDIPLVIKSSEPAVSSVEERGYETFDLDPASDGGEFPQMFPILLLFLFLI
jgi:hypothetical protein